MPSSNHHRNDVTTYEAELLNELFPCGSNDIPMQHVQFLNDMRSNDFVRLDAHYHNNVLLCRYVLTDRGMEAMNKHFVKKRDKRRVEKD